MDKLSNLIPKVLKKRGLDEQATASYAIYLANEWIEENVPEVLTQAKATTLSGGILEIEVTHPIAAQELAQHSEHVLHYINRYEGISVNEIRILRQKTPSNSGI